MLNKRALLRENEYLEKRVEEQRQEIYELNRKLFIPKNNIDQELQEKYLLLIAKYNKLMDSCLSSETEHITYNGEVYSITSIDYHKDAETLDTINIEAIHVPREKGLVNNLAEPFKNVAKELNKIFFGNEGDK